MRRIRRLLKASPLVFLVLSFSTSPMDARQRDRGNASRGLSDSALVATVGGRSIGPAVMSGRVSDIAVAQSPGTRGGALGTVIYVAAATGGVWKSTNGGVSWEPIFDDAGVGSVGDVAVAPSNSNVVWVGTGEANNMRSSSYGDGVYKSIDGGETFENMGLPASQHVGRIVIHPTNSDIVYVAAVGALWGPGGERGVFKTTDGGETWQHSLSIDEHTGVTDLVMDPTDSSVLYAAALQRERRAYSYVGGGPESGIYKSTDGGESWRKLTVGLPTSDMGRIGLDVSLSQPRTLYAVIEGRDGGVYRTDDYGEVWRKTSSTSSIPWYFGQIRVDPNDPDVVYHLGQPLQRSEDGGKTFERIARGVHVDHHAMWINPENSDHLMLGNDGGFYVSHDFGATWDFSPNLPISQFYTVGLDMQEPFFSVYGGLQDNSTWGGPSRTRYSMGVVNADWFRMAGGDGFYAAVDPVDHNIAYVESQNGNILRFDGRTGERKGIKPLDVPGEPQYRWNWSAPIMISPFDHQTVYFAANHLFKSTDRGDSWRRLGEDLTRNVDRDVLQMMGRIPDSNAVSRHQGTAVFSNISTIDVSTLQVGLLITGSDDGVVAVSQDDGQTWNRITRFPGVPDTAYVSRVVLSTHDAAVMYATFDNHRSNDFHPYVLKSADYGRSWNPIGGNLPEFGSVRAFAEHHRNPNLLFLGTEIAPFVSVDGGSSWMRITKDMPPVPIHDLAIHVRDNSLVIATHGRGFLVVDDIGALEHLAEARGAELAYVTPVAAALAFVPNTSGSSGTHADRDYAGANPDVGTSVTYLLKERREVKLEIVSQAGEVVRTLDAPGRPGWHRVSWDLRTDAPYDGPPEDGGRTNQPQGFQGFGGGQRNGPMVVPGLYTARLSVSSADDQEPLVLERNFDVVPDPMVLLAMQEQDALYATRARVAQANATLRMALRSADDVQAQIQGAKTAMEEVEVPGELEDSVQDLEDRIDSILVALRGVERPRGQPAPDTVPIPSVQARLRTAGGVNSATVVPTQVEREALESGEEALDEQVALLNQIVSTDLPDLFRALDEAGVPWSPGRPILVR